MEGYEDVDIGKQLQSNLIESTKSATTIPKHKLDGDEIEKAQISRVKQVRKDNMN